MEKFLDGRHSIIIMILACMSNLAAVMAEPDKPLLQMEESMPENIISAEIESLPNRTSEAALALQQLGFRILHIGKTISVQGVEDLWTSVFNVSFETRTKKKMAEIQGSEVIYQKALTEHMRIPPHLQSLIADVHFAEPPEFY